MATLHIEHQIHSFEAWKAAFDRDPAGRQQNGVRSYRISRPVDEPNYIIIDLDFDSASEAQAFRGIIQKVWQSPQAASALLGSPQTRIVEEVESKAL